MSHNNPSRRRWLSFSLRTAFVALTLLGVALGWLGWQVNWLRERRAFQEAHDGDQLYGAFGQGNPRVPGVLRWLGAQGIATIDISRMSESEITQAAKLFPEARLMADH